jgi:hypothetical protein
MRAGRDKATATGLGTSTRSTTILSSITRPVCCARDSKKKDIPNQGYRIDFRV